MRKLYQIYLLTGRITRMSERDELLMQYLQTLIKLDGTISPTERKQRIERVCDEIENCLGIKPIATLTLGSSEDSDSNKTLTVEGSHNGGAVKTGTLTVDYTGLNIEAAENEL